MQKKRSYSFQGLCMGTSTLLMALVFLGLVAFFPLIFRKVTTSGPTGPAWKVAIISFSEKYIDRIDQVSPATVDPNCIRKQKPMEIMGREIKIEEEPKSEPQLLMPFAHYGGMIINSTKFLARTFAQYAQTATIMIFAETDVKNYSHEPTPMVSQKMYHMVMTMCFYYTSVNEPNYGELYIKMISHILGIPIEDAETQFALLVNADETMNSTVPYVSDRLKQILGVPQIGSDLAITINAIVAKCYSASSEYMKQKIHEQRTQMDPKA